MAVPKQSGLGPRYDGDPGDNPFDPPPHKFHDFIAKWIRGSRRAVVMDRDPYTQVWSHPLWKYEANMWADLRDKMRVDVTCVLYYVNSSNNPDYIMNDPPELDLYVTHMALDYWLKYDQAGKVVDGRWKPAHPNRAENPDFLWVPVIPRSPGPCQANLNSTKVDEILTP